MTNEEFDEIKELLKLYRKQKGTTIKQCKQEFNDRFFEAFLEYQKALQKCSQEKFLEDAPQYLIDSLCAMAVVAINAGRADTVFCCDDGFYAVSTSVRRIFDALTNCKEDPYECMKNFIEEQSC